MDDAPVPSCPVMSPGLFEKKMRNYKIDHRKGIYREGIERGGCIPR